MDKLSSLISAQVYFPPGTYLVSGSIIDYYNTQIIGNPKCLPVIKGASNLTARWIIDGDQVWLFRFLDSLTLDLHN